MHESVYEKEIPQDIQVEADAQPTLFRQKLIETQESKADKVYRSIPTKICPRALDLVQVVFLSCMENKELAILRFLLFGYKEKAKVVQQLGHPLVAPLLAAEKHLLGEQHLLTGFIRFSDYDGVLAAAISPKNFVLPFIEGHFISRFPVSSL